MVVLPLFSSGTVTMLSGLMVSTGAEALFPLLAEAAVSPVEPVIFFPQPTKGAATMAQKSTAEAMRGITHCGSIAHLSLVNGNSPLSVGGFAGDTWSTRLIAGRCASRKGKMDRVSSRQRKGTVPKGANSAYFTFEKSAGMRISLPSCRFTTNMDAAFGSKLSYAKTAVNRDR